MRAVAISVALILSLVACGGSDDSAEAEPSDVAGADVSQNIEAESSGFTEAEQGEFVDWCLANRLTDELDCRVGADLIASSVAEGYDEECLVQAIELSLTEPEVNERNRLLVAADVECAPDEAGNPAPTPTP